MARTATATSCAPALHWTPTASPPTPTARSPCHRSRSQTWDILPTFGCEFGRNRAVTPRGVDWCDGTRPRHPHPRRLAAWSDQSATSCGHGGRPRPTCTIASHGNAAADVAACVSHRRIAGHARAARPRRGARCRRAGRALAHLGRGMVATSRIPARARTCHSPSRRAASTLASLHSASAAGFSRASK